MNTYINFNGSFIPQDKVIVNADNRGLRYGDGLFETIKVMNNKIALAGYHFERLFEGLRALQFEQPALFTEENLSSQILELCKKNGHQRLARIRLMIFRGDGGLYDPEDHFPRYVIQSKELPAKNTQLNESGLVTGIFPDGRKACDRFSNLKSNNFLIYAMAALYAGKNQLDDCLVLNAHNRICESTAANVFCIKEGMMYTPSLSEGCVAGVMRRYLLKTLPGAGYMVHEKQLTVEDIAQADEVFFSNAISGIRWVRGFGDTAYGNQQTSTIYNTLLKNLS